MADASSKLSGMASNEPRRTVVLGIDPGRSTGLFSASIPKLDQALTLDEFLRDGEWLGNAVISLSTRESITKLQAWREMQDRLDGAVAKCDPDLIVLEYPADGMPKWSGGTARGVDFHMGMFFGFAALAAATWQDGTNKCEPDGVNIALCPVTSSKAKNRVGWMPRVTTQKGKRKVTHTQAREITLRQCREIAHALGINSGNVASEAIDALSEHELMACGVLTWYVTNIPPLYWGIN